MPSADERRKSDGDLPNDLNGLDQKVLVTFQCGVSKTCKRSPVLGFWLKFCLVFKPEQLKLSVKKSLRAFHYAPSLFFVIYQNEFQTLCFSFRLFELT